MADPEHRWLGTGRRLIDYDDPLERRHAESDELVEWVRRIERDEGTGKQDWRYISDGYNAKRPQFELTDIR